MKRLISLAVVSTALLTPAMAEVVSADANSASIRIVAPVTASPDRAYAAFLQIGRWWDKAHTWSGNSANLKLDAFAGGCFCETLPNGGSVLHLTVVYVVPNQRVTLSGALGPLQTAGLAGALSFSFVPTEKGSDIRLVYNIGGYYPKGLDSVTGAVNEVLQSQVDRLQRLVDTGSPDAPAKPAP